MARIYILPVSENPLAILPRSSGMFELDILYDVRVKSHFDSSLLEIEYEFMTRQT